MSTKAKEKFLEDKKYALDGMREVKLKLGMVNACISDEDFETAIMGIGQAKKKLDDVVRRLRG
jgi:hypothetical protein